MGKLVRNLRYQIATLSLTLESLPTKDNTGSKFVLVIGKEDDGNIATNLSIFIGGDPVSIMVKDIRYIGIGTEIDKMVPEILTANAVSLNEAHESSIESVNPKLTSQVPSAVMTMLTESNAIAEYVRNQIGQSEPNFKDLSPGDQVEIVIREAKNAYKDPTVMLKAFEEVIQKYPNTQEIYDSIPRVAIYPTVQYEGMDGEISEHLNKVFESIGMDRVRIEITKIRGGSPNFTLTTTLPDGQKLGIDFSPGGVSVAENGTVEVTGSLTDVNGNKEEKVITFLKEPDISGTGDLVIKGENNKIIISIPKLVPVDTLTGEVVDPLLDPNREPVLTSLLINNTLTTTDINNTLTKTITDSSGINTGVITGGGEDNQTMDSQKISNPSDNYTSPDDTLAEVLASGSGQDNVDPLTGDTDQESQTDTTIPDITDNEPVKPPDDRINKLIENLTRLKDTGVNTDNTNDLIIGNPVGPNGFGRIGANNPFYDPLTNGGSDHPANEQYDEFIVGDKFFNGDEPTQATSEILPPDPLASNPLTSSGWVQGTDPLADPLAGTLRSGDIANPY